MNDHARMIICYFDYKTIPALATYLEMTPKEVNDLYSDMVDNGTMLEYRKRAAKELDIRLLNNRITRIERRCRPIVS